MYGLTDPMNPNTLKVLLIPCGSMLDEQALQALVSKAGYYDHQGQLYTLKEAMLLVANFVEYTHQQDQNWSYKEVTRGNFFGKNSLNNLMQDEECTQVLYQLGYADQVIKPILEPLNILGCTFKEVYMDVGAPCPTTCGVDPADIGTNTICLATAAVNIAASVEDLDLYRQFRDELLLDMPEGKVLYEMYYFISPLISAVMQEQGNSEGMLRNFYTQSILPFHQLIQEQRYVAATKHLSDTLHELIEAYQVDFV